MASDEDGESAGGSSEDEERLLSTSLSGSDEEESRSSSSTSLPILGFDTVSNKSTIAAERWMTMIVSIFAFLALAFVVSSYSSQEPLSPSSTGCTSVEKGYQCEPQISHRWGQYSPYFSVPSEISATVPNDCEITFAQILSRHGGRFPTTSKSAAYGEMITKIQSTAKSFNGPWKFLADYRYTLGAEDLTSFGEEEMYRSGIKFFNRYSGLAIEMPPFIRASSQSRVVISAEKFALGFNSVKDSGANLSVIISEADGSNNTLDHGLCRAFETDHDHSFETDIQRSFSDTFVPKILKRVLSYLPGAKISKSDIISLMDLCPYETVASANGQPLAVFCSLFTVEEWKSYDYYHTLDKYYRYGPGNPLGPTQGVGFTNELIARLTNKPVHDHTSTNSTLTSNPVTFPLGLALYADFTHDNDMTGIFGAMELYDAVAPLSTGSIIEPVQMNGYSAAWTVPFAARAYVEKMKCRGQDEELVRVLVNDRVIALRNCGADDLGRCQLGRFIDSLSFARNGGKWADCFK